MRLQLRKTLPVETYRRLEEIFLSMCHDIVRSALVEGYLNDEERFDVKGRKKDQTTAIVTTVARRRQQTKERTLIDLARFSDLIGNLEYCRLCRAIGESPSQICQMGSRPSLAIGESPTPTEHPVTIAERKKNKNNPYWNRANGELWFRNKLIRRVRICKDPTNGQLILDAFEAADWRSPISIPSTDMDPGKVHSAVNYLNEPLNLKLFHVQGGGSQITWKLKPK
jgi:hypothetical protein